jgi:hypothetical protein
VEEEAEEGEEEAGEAVGCCYSVVSVSFGS